jgi:hypothetical protein
MPRTRGASAGGGSSPFYVRDLGTLDTKLNDSTQTLTANRVYYCPLQVPHQLTIDGIIVVHGAVAGGNYYIGLYDSLNYAPNNRLAVSLSTLCSGTFRKQYTALTVASIQVAAGLYFIALEADNANDLFLEGSGLSSVFAPAGIGNGLNYYYEDLGGFLAPPAAATPIQGTNFLYGFKMFARVSSIP